MQTANLGLSSREQEMFMAVAQTMAQFPDVERKFNLAFQHQHFPLSDNETLLESNDPQSRILTTQVVKKTDIGENAIPTQWQVSANSPAQVEQWCCDDITPVQWCCDD